MKFYGNNTSAMNSLELITKYYLSYYIYYVDIYALVIFHMDSIDVDTLIFLQCHHRVRQCRTCVGDYCKPILNQLKRYLVLKELYFNIMVSGTRSQVDLDTSMTPLDCIGSPK